MGIFDQINKDEQPEEGYIITTEHLEELCDYWDSLERKEEPFFALFSCVDRGIDQVDLKNFDYCYNPKCGHCSFFRDKLKKLAFRK